MIADKLKALGFIAGDAAAPRELDDFYAQDDSDGRGAYIRKWMSKKQCPFPNLVREPVAVVPEKEFTAARDSEKAERFAAKQEAEKMEKAAEIIKQTQAAAQEALNTYAAHAQSVVDSVTAERDAALARVRELEAKTPRAAQDLPAEPEGPKNPALHWITGGLLGG